MKAVVLFFALVCALATVACSDSTTESSKRQLSNSSKRETEEITSRILNMIEEKYRHAKANLKRWKRKCKRVCRKNKRGVYKIKKCAKEKKKHVCFYCRHEFKCGNVFKKPPSPAP